jgi:hypothetical protein
MLPGTSSKQLLLYKRSEASQCLLMSSLVFLALDNNKDRSAKQDGGLARQKERHVNTIYSCFSTDPIPEK